MAQVLSLGEKMPLNIGVTVDLTGAMLELVIVDPQGTRSVFTPSINTGSYTAPDGTVYAPNFSCFRHLTPTDFRVSGEHAVELTINASSGDVYVERFYLAVEGRL